MKIYEFGSCLVGCCMCFPLWAVVKFYLYKEGIVFTKCIEYCEWVTQSPFQTTSHVQETIIKIPFCSDSFAAKAQYVIADSSIRYTHMWDFKSESGLVKIGYILRWSNCGRIRTFMEAPALLWLIEMRTVCPEQNQKHLWRGSFLRSQTRIVASALNMYLSTEKNQIRFLGFQLRNEEC